MAFKKPRINVVTPDIASASIYLRSVKKWGKTTLFARVIEEKYHDAGCGLLVEVGEENGTTMLDGVNTTHVDTIDDLKELKKWLIAEKDKEHHVKIVAFDTADELVPIFEKYVINEHNKANPTKPVKTINGACGGFGMGEKTAAALLKSYLSDFKKAGFQVWVIGHTKYKNIKDKANVDTEGYMQLTSNLSAAYESALGDTFDVVLTGVIDRDIDIEVQKAKIGDQSTEYRHPTTAVRKLYFRGTPEIDAGGRFASDTVPEYMVFDKPNMAKEFIEVIEKGIAASQILSSSAKAEAIAVSQKMDIEEGIPDEPSETTYPEDFESVETASVYVKNLFGSTTKEVKQMVLTYVKDNCEGSTFANATLTDLKNVYDIIMSNSSLED